MCNADYLEISVIIPTFNRSFTLLKTLNSILAQTYKYWELIIIDDGSTDKTRDKIKPYISEKIRYVRTPHKGTPYAWNLGVRLSKNDYLFFTGDDVILHRNCLAILAETVRKVKRKDLGAVAPRLIYYSGNLREGAKREYAHIDPYSGDVVGSFNVDGEGISEVPITHGYTLIRKEAFLSVGGFDEESYRGNYFREETDLWLRLRKKGYKIYYQPKAKLYCQGGLTKGGQWSNVRGSLALYEYYVLRNHLVFLKKFYGGKAYFMFMPFIFRRLHLRLNQVLKKDFE